MSELDLVLALARAMSQKGNITSSQLNTLFSPELAYLSNTAYDDGSASEIEAMQYAPNIRLALQAGETDPKNIRYRIVNEIVENGKAPWDVKAQIEEYASAQAKANPATYNKEGETQDLMSFADTVFREHNALSVARSKRSSQSTGNLPPMDARFAPEQLMPEYFLKFAEESMARQKEMDEIAAPKGKQLQSARNYVSNLATNVKRAEEPPGMMEAIGATFTGRLRGFGEGGGIERKTTEEGGYVPTAEDRRFGRIAQTAVAKADDPELQKRRALLVKTQTDAQRRAENVGLMLQQAAEEIGYTPALAALLQRAAVMRGGR